MARFVFEQLGGRCKLVDKDFFVRCTDEEIAVAERLKAEKVKKMKQREERHQARSEEEFLAGNFVVDFDAQVEGMIVKWLNKNWNTVMLGTLGLDFFGR